MAVASISVPSVRHWRGYIYELLISCNQSCLYSQKNSFNDIIGFEVFRLRYRAQREIRDQVIGPSVRFPSDEDFGKDWAWSYGVFDDDDRQEALDRALNRANDNSGLNEFNNKKWVVLIWVFADWCPVYHGEFRDLMKMKEEFEEINTQIFVIRIFSRRKILYLVLFQHMKTYLLHVDWISTQIT